MSGSAESAPSAKTIATLKARAALAGVTVHEMSSGEYVAGRWNLSRTFTSLEELERWLDQIGAPR